MIRADGRTSWFDDTTTASGDHRTPGIAVARSDTMGGFWWVKMPNGRSPILKQIDWGPNPSVNRTVDVHSNAFGAVGYNGSNFPTDSRVQAVYLGKSAAGAAQQASRMGLRVTPGGAVQPTPGVRRAMEGVAPPGPQGLQPSQIAGAGPTAAPKPSTAGLRAAMGGIPNVVLPPPPSTADAGLGVALRRAKLI